MTSKNPFDLPRPKIHIQTVELGPHRRRVFVLPKEEVNQKYTPLLWVIATIIVGFSVSATIFDSAIRSYKFVKDTLLKEDVIAFEAPQNRLLGSDDFVDDISTNNKEIVGGDYFKINDRVSPPRTDALSFLVADVDSGQIILEKNTDMVLPIASVSKLMTAVVAKEVLDLHSPITVSRSSVDTYGTSGGLVVGEKILGIDLLPPLLIESSNDAAEVLASGYGRIEFIRRMNLKARSLGMTNTFFDDPSGLSANNTSNVGDLLILAQYIDDKFPELWDMARVKEYAILKHKWQNGNNQLRKQSFIGGKNGYTDEALRTSVSLFEVPVVVKDKATKERKRIAIIILKSADRDGDIDRLLRFVENSIGFAENDEDKEIIPKLQEKENTAQ